MRAFTRPSLPRFERARQRWWRLRARRCATSAPMPGLFKDYGEAVARALGVVVAKARQPTERVARHWESTDRLTWFGANADHHLVHASWSYGHLRGVPAEGPRASVGIFAVTAITFPELDEAGLRAAHQALVPEGVDGATRVFLLRVAAQLAVADVVLTLPEQLGCEISLFARIDAVDQPAATARWPERARERVTAALDLMDPLFAARCEALFSAEAKELLEAVRGAVH